MTATCGDDGESRELPGAMGIVAGHAGIERMSHLKLRAPLDNCLAMRIFGRFRSVFALPSRMTGKSSTSEEVTRDAQVDGYHL